MNANEATFGRVKAAGGTLYLAAARRSHKRASRTDRAEPRQRRAGPSERHSTSRPRTSRSRRSCPRTPKARCGCGNWRSCRSTPRRRRPELSASKLPPPPGARHRRCFHPKRASPLGRLRRSLGTIGRSPGSYRLAPASASRSETVASLTRGAWTSSRPSVGATTVKTLACPTQCGSLRAFPMNPQRERLGE
jgi:hypothetical protein